MSSAAIQRVKISGIIDLIMPLIFCNRAPGQAWQQNRPETITDTLFESVKAKLGTSQGATRWGLSFILSYLDGPPDALAETLARLCDQSVRTQIPLLIVLDGQNWWGHSKEIWQDPQNVEWTWWGSEHAVRIGWRNWGQQIRVLPQPNLASPAFRRASSEAMTPLLAHLAKFQKAHPTLCPGVKIGWETSVGINAYYYLDGNLLLNKDPSGDPTTGLDMSKDFAGGLPKLGYAALTAIGKAHKGEITLADHEAIVTNYFSFLIAQCKRAGFGKSTIFTHAGGQYAPWEKHYSHRTALHKDATPGWSFYGTPPKLAGDLDAVLQHAKQHDWCAAEWFPMGAKTTEDWETAFRDTLTYRRCRFISLYNWESIQENTNAISALLNLYHSS
jgi:hypothetical protein